MSFPPRSNETGSRGRPYAPRSPNSARYGFNPAAAPLIIVVDALPPSRLHALHRRIKFAPQLADAILDGPAVFQRAGPPVEVTAAADHRHERSMTSDNRLRPFERGAAAFGAAPRFVLEPRASRSA